MINLHGEESGTRDRAKSTVNSIVSYYHTLEDNAKRSSQVNLLSPGGEEVPAATEGEGEESDRNGNGDAAAERSESTAREAENVSESTERANGEKEGEKGVMIESGPSQSAPERVEPFSIPPPSDPAPMPPGHADDEREERTNARCAAVTDGHEEGGATSTHAVAEEEQASTSGAEGGEGQKEEMKRAVERRTNV